ncbi:Thiamine-monophosphate kinase [Mycobacteroides salmoniphilum]|uniref:Thiamine-monophosphate kinase n=1 Tax=Mycobacteroides salmoniphilum TaxID=404941 RepID=A0A4R8S2R8_9MYCO|nr:thiamine-phosphate kinase [Mycobacteroides salmoniphilum]TDZ76826.1 Thiamine-monophosphate kinase [Mycobacteroides salmoniphilum]TDZ82750.1 Thiamine-monophosphate kinase [Mycobacteroides salmoniphilum]TDZ86986.1 Thiamine-monophosphate kinase [Mycobacteroides salmoniphilum]
MPNLGDTGEFGVISRLTAGRVFGADIELGPGDDAAVVRAPDSRVLVSTDMLVQDRHFRLDWSSPSDIGRKAVAQNAADIEAMGGRVTAFVVAVGAPAETDIAFLDQLNEGIWSEAARVQASVAGGDLVAARELVVSVTALGDLQGRAPVTRSAAAVGDTVAVCGALGTSAAGLRLWQDGIDQFPELRQVHLVPVPPYGQGRVAALAGATAMTDVSDGLLADLGHIAQSSAVHIDLSSPSLEPYLVPVAGASGLLGADPWEWILTGGEEHALVATFPGTLPADWVAIGEVRTGDPGVTVDGVAWTQRMGWDSFA